MSQIIQEVPESLRLPDNLSKESVRTIRDRNCDGKGTKARVWFMGDKAIRVPFIENSLELIIRGVEISQHIENEGVNVPQIFGIGETGRALQPHFLLMEKLNIANYADLNMNEKVIAGLSYARQIAIAKSLGYAPKDSGVDLNCGFNREKEQVYFYDFEDWEGQN